MDCVKCKNLLSEFELNELGDELTAEVEKHVEQCEKCASFLSALRKMSELTASLVDHAPPQAMTLRIRNRADDQNVPGMADAPEIMNLEQLARFLQVPIEKLSEEIDQLPGFMIGDELRFRKISIIEWIEEREKQRERQNIYSQLRVV